MSPDGYRSEGTPSLSEGPDAGARPFGSFSWRLTKGTRRKGETISRRYRSNGYVHSQQNTWSALRPPSLASQLLQWIECSRARLGGCQAVIAGKPAPTVDRVQPRGMGWLSGRLRWQASSHSGLNTATPARRIAVPLVPTSLNTCVCKKSRPEFSGQDLSNRTTPHHSGNRNQRIRRRPSAFSISRRRINPHCVDLRLQRLAFLARQLDLAIPTFGVDRPQAPRSRQVTYLGWLYGVGSTPRICAATLLPA